MLNFSSPQTELLQNTAFSLLLLEMELPMDGLAAGGAFLCHALANMPQPLRWIWLLPFSALCIYSSPLSVPCSNFPLSKLIFLTFSLHSASYFPVTFSSFPISNDNTGLKRQVYSQLFSAYLSTSRNKPSAGGREIKLEQSHGATSLQTRCSGPQCGSKD